MKIPSHLFKKEQLAVSVGLTLLPFNAVAGLLPLLFASLSPWFFHGKKLASLPLAKVWAALTLWFLLTTITAHDRGEALLGLANFVPYFIVFLAFSQVICQFKQLNNLAWLLTANTVVLIIFGFGQIYGDWATPNWLAAIGTNLVAGGRPEGRMSSLLMYANLFSAWLLMVFPLSLGLLIQCIRRWHFTAPSNRLNPPPLVWALLVACILEAIALVLTGSRSAWGIGLLIGIAYAIYLSWYWLVALAGGATAMVLWASFGPFGKEPLRQIVPKYFWGRLSDELYPDRYTTALRSTQWQFSWDMFLDQPIFGQGLRNFTPLYQAAMNVWIGHPHNLVLMLLGETGLIGTGLMLGAVGFILAQGMMLLINLGRCRGFRRQSQHLLLLSYGIAFAALCLYNLFDVTIFDMRNNVLGWIFLAAIAGVSQRYGAKLAQGNTAQLEVPG
ncbi:O-antigen ligase [Synechocystis sp. PCC 7339]|uniref:O-antigen ligase family protein n=1 Tax=Synechocystis sp. PCC 7339 TaxID=2782213 RepID=UPI001CBC0560|nr:O-antigen ligase [Synechocystis sp. PCC 7339]